MSYSSYKSYNSYIARLLSIETDSVKKTRQRLRAKLAIPPTTNLRDFIAQI